MLDIHGARFYQEGMELGEISGLNPVCEFLAWLATLYWLAVATRQLAKLWVQGQLCLIEEQEEEKMSRSGFIRCRFLVYY